MIFDYLILNLLVFLLQSKVHEQNINHIVPLNSESAHHQYINSKQTFSFFCLNIFKLRYIICHFKISFRRHN